MPVTNTGACVSRPPRLAFATLPGLDHFVPALARALNDSGRVEARMMPIRTAADMAAVLAWADDPAHDTVWLEFCWPPFPSFLASTDFGGRRVVIRVHRIEAYETDHVARTDLGSVNDMIVVSRDMARVVREVRPDIDGLVDLHVLCNGVALDRVAPRLAFDPFRIGWCGAFIARKNPTLALQVLHRLRQVDTRYRLHVASQSGDRLTTESFCHQAALLNLADAVVLEGRIGAEAIPAWHAANGVLLSTSLHESFGMGIAEAAAAGCDLAVLDHVGAEEFWPEEVRYITIEQASDRILAARPQRWVRLAAERFDVRGQADAVVNLLAAPRRLRFQGSADYWERRYRAGGGSGAGSTGRLANFKAEVLNRLVIDHRVNSVVEFGCGDGQQLAHAQYPSYLGFDVSPASVELCRQRFANDPRKRFQLVTAAPEAADLALSLDVVFHLVEDDVFDAYMRRLFGAARRLVAIYASDRDEPTKDAHVRHRDISSWVSMFASDWVRMALIRNPYPWDPVRPAETSFADFHIFARRDDPVTLHRLEMEWVA